MNAVYRGGGDRRNRGYLLGNFIRAATGRQLSSAFESYRGENTVVVVARIKVIHWGF